MGWGSRTYFTGHREPSVWAGLGMMGTNLSFTTDEVVVKLGLGYIKNQSPECAMDTAVRYTLLNAGENGEINAKQMLNEHTRLAALVEEGLIADGWYRPSPTVEEPNPKPVRAWVYTDEFHRLWHNKITSEHYYKNTHFAAALLGKAVAARAKGRYYSFSLYAKEHYQYNYAKLWRVDKFATRPVEGNQRFLSQVLDDKVVLRAINKSLNRMTKSEKAIQVTSGRGRTFRWNSWGWMDKVRNRHLITMAKQRKLGDVVNGWEFTKGSVEMIHGVEICNHTWKPATPLMVWNIKVNIPSWDDYYSWKSDCVRSTTHNLPYMFFDKEEANDVLEQLSSAATPVDGISIRVDGAPRTHTYSLYSKDYTQNMQVKGEAVIEDYMPPLEMFKQMQFGPHQRFKQLRETLKVSPKKMGGSTNTKE